MNLKEQCFYSSPRLTFDIFYHSYIIRNTIEAQFDEQLPQKYQFLEI